MNCSLKDSFIVRHQWIESLMGIPDREFKEMIVAMHKFSKTGENPSFSGFKKIAWETFHIELKNDMEKYIERCEKNRENGKMGGRKPKRDKIGFM